MKLTRISLVLEGRVKDGHQRVGKKVAPERKARRALAKRVLPLTVLLDAIWVGYHVRQVEADGLGVDAICGVIVKPETIGHLVLPADGAVAVVPRDTAHLGRVAQDCRADAVAGHVHGRDADGVVVDVAHHHIRRPRRAITGLVVVDVVYRVSAGTCFAYRRCLAKTLTPFVPDGNCWRFTSLFFFFFFFFFKN